MKIFAWGANSYGQLGIGIQSEQCIKPTEVKQVDSDLNVNKITSIAGGGGHTLVLDKLGRVFGCGWNNQGQLTGDSNTNVTFKKITALQNYKVIQIACGWDFSYAVTQEGSVFGWGSNHYGQLGITESHTEAAVARDPIKLDVPEITQVSAGLRHAALLTSSGLVLVCGKGHKGQLGLMGDNSLPVKQTGVFKKVNGVADVKQVACGQQHTIAVTNNNRVFVWGDNKNGQLGLDPATVPYIWTPQQISLSHLSPLQSDVTVGVGWTHTALLSAGKIINWGRNIYYQLGGSREYPWRPQELPHLEEVQQLVVGSEHNIARLITGEVVSWGWNEHGNCGCGGTDNILSPTSVKLPGYCELIGVGSGQSFAVIK